MVAMPDLEVRQPACSDDFVRTLGQTRQRVQEFLAAKSQWLRHVRADLANQIERMDEALRESQTETASARRDIHQRGDELARQAEDLTRFDQELRTREAHWKEFHDRSIEQYQRLADEIRRQQVELANRQASLDQRGVEIDRREAELHRARRTLTLAQQEYQADREHVVELRSRLEEELVTVTTQREELVAARARTEFQRRRLAEEFRRRRAALLGELKRRRKELDQFQESCSEQTASPAAAPPDRRVETAPVEDPVGEAEKRIAILLGSLSEADDGKQDIPAPPDALDQSREEESSAQKLEHMLQASEQLVADKDREIAELKHLLENQSNNIGTVAVGAAALGNLLDADAIIREEREKLRCLQDEWREKLAKAEIEISVERATIARRRLELEESTRDLTENPASSEVREAVSAKPEKCTPRRWLNRLGLNGSADT
jgi:hypothetical protein